LRLFAACSALPSRLLRKKSIGRSPMPVRSIMTDRLVFRSRIPTASLHAVSRRGRCGASQTENYFRLLRFDVLSGRPGARIVLHVGHLPNGRYEPEEANPP
jgi:hypothetical protein